MLTNSFAFRNQPGILRLPLLSVAESIYLLGIIPVEIYNMFLHNCLGFAQKLPFLPLMITSLYSAIGVTYCWLKFYYLTFEDRPKKVKTNWYNKRSEYLETHEVLFTCLYTLFFKWKLVQCKNSIYIFSLLCHHDTSIRTCTSFSRLNVIGWCKLGVKGDFEWDFLSLSAFPF